jgi:hypothetical protein
MMRIASAKRSRVAGGDPVMGPVEFLTYDKALELGEEWDRRHEAEEMEIIFLIPPPSGECEMCGEVDELRPYGPNGEWVCFECAMQDEEAAGEKFEELFAAYNNKEGSMDRRAADWKVEMYVGDNVVGTFELEDVVDERAGVESIIENELDWEAYPLGKGRYRVQISVGGQEIGEWEIDGEDENDAMFSAVDRYIDWDFVEVDKREGSMKRQAKGLTDADTQKIIEFLNKDTQRHLDYMHDNPDYANNFSDLPKQENYTSMEYGKKIGELVKKYDMTVEDIAEALEPEYATCEMFWGHRKLDEDESVVFGFYNIDEEELQFDDGMDIELSVGTIGICSALAMLTDDQFRVVQKGVDEFLPDNAQEQASRPSPNFEIYIGVDGYVAVYRDTEDAVKMIEDWAKDQGKTEEEPEEE